MKRSNPRKSASSRAAKARARSPQASKKDAALTPETMSTVPVAHTELNGINVDHLPLKVVDREDIGEMTVSLTDPRDHVVVKVVDLLRSFAPNGQILGLASLGIVCAMHVAGESTLGLTGIALIAGLAAVALLKNN